MYEYQPRKLYTAYDIDTTPRTIWLGLERFSPGACYCQPRVCWCSSEWNETIHSYMIAVTPKSRNLNDLDSGSANHDPVLDSCLFLHDSLAKSGFYIFK